MAGGTADILRNSAKHDKVSIFFFTVFAAPAYPCSHNPALLQVTKSELEIPETAPDENDEFVCRRSPIAGATRLLFFHSQKKLRWHAVSLLLRRQKPRGWSARRRNEGCLVTVKASNKQKHIQLRWSPNI